METSKQWLVLSNLSPKQNFPRVTYRLFPFILSLVYQPNYCLEEDFYSKSPELRDKFELLKQLVTSVSYKELPAISLSIAYDLNYKVDVFKLWKQITDEVQKHVHHYTPI